MAKKTKRKTVVDYPELMAQCYPTKKGDLRPEDVSAETQWLPFGSITHKSPPPKIPRIVAVDKSFCFEWWANQESNQEPAN